MKKRYGGVKKKTMVCLPVFLVVTLLLSSTLLAFAENSDGTTSFSKNYVTHRQDVSCQDPDCQDVSCRNVDYQVDRVIVERVKVEPGADIEQFIPRGIQFIFYGYEAKQVSVLVNSKVEQRWVANYDVPPTPVYSVMLDGESRRAVTWMFVEERYNAWQSRGFVWNPATLKYDLPTGLQPGMKPEFFTYPNRMWNVYDNSIASNENFVAERGYNDFVYRPSHPTDPMLVNTYYMDYAVEHSMEFLEIVANAYGVDHLVATFHVYPIHLSEYDPWPGEGGIQGEDEE